MALVKLAKNHDITVNYPQGLKIKGTNIGPVQVHRVEKGLFEVIVVVGPWRRGGLLILVQERLTPRYYHGVWNGVVEQCAGCSRVAGARQ
jgi:hypothetical protein